MILRCLRIPGWSQLQGIVGEQQAQQEVFQRRVLFRVAEGSFDHRQHISETRAQGRFRTQSVALRRGRGVRARSEFDAGRSSNNAILPHAAAQQAFP